MGAAHFLVTGAGLSGAVLARELAAAGHRVSVMEMRDHVAGNCHTRRDPQTGVLVHVYGPHIFHTDDARVWEYVNRFARFRPYRHRVLSTAAGRVYSMPLNLLTINQFFGTTLSPQAARARISGGAEKSATRAPRTFEEQALALMGRPLYETFFKGYTEKQWGCPADTLPASILKRLPLRFDYNDSYFSQRFQGMPEEGYTEMVRRILDHPGITLYLNCRAKRHMAADFTHVFHSGPLDGWYGHDLGRLPYRTLEFQSFVHAGDFQGTPVMNYADSDIPYTRITEHKHFAPWEEHSASVVTLETPRAARPGDIPYYPVRLAREKHLLARYEARARAERHVTFIGRLGTYRYLDMDRCIGESLALAETYRRVAA